MHYHSPVTDSIFQSLAAAAAANQPVALGIITGVKGSSPQKLGAKALFYPDRKIKGTLGGGCLEAEAQRMALGALKSGKPESTPMPAPAVMTMASASCSILAAAAAGSINGELWGECGGPDSDHA